MSFAGMHVLSLESRRSAEIAELIRKQGGEPVAGSFHARSAAGAQRGGLRIRRAPLRRRVRHDDPAHRRGYAPAASGARDALSAGTLCRGPAPHHRGGPRTEARRRPAWTRCAGHHRRARAQYLARVAGRHPRSSGAAHRRPGIRTPQHRAARRPAPARRGSGHRARLPVGLAGRHRTAARRRPPPGRRRIACGALHHIYSDRTPAAHRRRKRDRSAPCYRPCARWWSLLSVRQPAKRSKKPACTPTSNPPIRRWDSWSRRQPSAPKRS